MVGIASVLIAVLLLGSAFIAVEGSKRAPVQKWGRWAVGATACIISTVIVATCDRNLLSLDQPFARHRLVELLQTTGLMAVLATEAVVLSHWSMRTQATKRAYLIVFGCLTIVAWFLTFLVTSSVIPGS